MENLNIGIIGGCMTFQKDIKISQLFHRRFSSLVNENHGIKTYFYLKYYDEFSQIPQLANELFEKQDINIMIVQIRPEPFFKRAAFIIDNHKGKYIINPTLLNNKGLKSIEKILGTKDPVYINSKKDLSIIKYYSYLPFLMFNYQIGHIFGLTIRSKNGILGAINLVNEKCMERKIPLIVIGILNSLNKHSDKVAGKLNTDAKKAFIKSNLHYIDIYSTINKDLKKYFSEDKYHLSYEGHLLISDMLYDTFRTNLL